MSFIIIYITHKDLSSAKKVCDVLLTKRLIACVNYFPIKSSYHWMGKIEDSKEIVSIVKTRKENWKKVEEEVKKIHPYKVPCIMRIEVDSNKEYDSWIKEETK